MSHPDSPFGNFHLRTDIPYFSGDFVDWWIYHIECFFYDRQVLPDQKISIAEMFLVRESLEWYQEWEWQMRQYRQQITWEDFVSSLKARFESVETLKPQSEVRHSILNMFDEDKEISIEFLEPPVIGQNMIIDTEGEGEIITSMIPVELGSSSEPQIQINVNVDEDETTFEQSLLELSSTHRYLAKTHQVNTCVPVVCGNACITIILDFYLSSCCTDDVSWSCGGLHQFSLTWFEEPPQIPPDISNILSDLQGLLMQSREFAPRLYMIVYLVCTRKIIKPLCCDNVCEEVYGQKRQPLYPDAYMGSLVLSFVLNDVVCLESKIVGLICNFYDKTVFGALMVGSANEELVRNYTAKGTSNELFAGQLWKYIENGTQVGYNIDMIHIDWKFEKSVWWSLNHKWQSSMDLIIGYLLHIYTY